MTEGDFNGSALPGPKIPTSLRVAATTLFTTYAAWGDLVRMALGLAVCAWLVIQLWNGPKTANGYRVWLYLGLVAVPFASICLVAIW